MSDPTGGRKGPTATRLVIWVVAGGAALYLIVNGLIGIVQKGG